MFKIIFLFFLFIIPSQYCFCGSQIIKGAATTAVTAGGVEGAKRGLNKLSDILQKDGCDFGKSKEQKKLEELKERVKKLEEKINDEIL